MYRNLPVDLVLVRHGQSEGNLAQKLARKGELIQWTDQFRERHNSLYRLTDAGRLQASIAGSWIRNNVCTMFDKYFTSEYIRAMETAANLSLPRARWSTEIYLRERDRGVLANKPYPERETEHRDEMLRKARDSFYWQPSGGESLANMCLRVDRVLENLCENCSGLRIIIVCHGGVIKSFRALIERNCSTPVKRGRERIHNCQIVWYTRRDPNNGYIASKYNWVKSVCPWNLELSTQGNNWREIYRHVYSNEDMLRSVHQVPLLVNSSLSKSMTNDSEDEECDTSDLDQIVLPVAIMPAGATVPLSPRDEVHDVPSSITCTKRITSHHKLAPMSSIQFSPTLTGTENKPSLKLDGKTLQRNTANPSHRRSKALDKLTSEVVTPPGESHILEHSESKSKRAGRRSSTCTSKTPSNVKSKSPKNIVFKTQGSNSSGECDSSKLPKETSKGEMPKEGEASLKLESHKSKKKLNRNQSCFDKSINPDSKSIGVDNLTPRLTSEEKSQQRTPPVPSDLCNAVGIDTSRCKSEERKNSKTENNENSKNENNENSKTENDSSVMTLESNEELSFSEPSFEKGIIYDKAISYEICNGSTEMKEKKNLVRRLEKCDSDTSHLTRVDIDCDPVFNTKDREINTFQNPVAESENNSLQSLVAETEKTLQSFVAESEIVLLSISPNFFPTSSSLVQDTTLLQSPLFPGNPSASTGSHAASLQLDKIAVSDIAYSSITPKTGLKSRS